MFIYAYSSSEKRDKEFERRAMNNTWEDLKGGK